MSGLLPVPRGGAPEHSGYQIAYGLYLSYQATEKLGLYTRGEFFNQSGYLADQGGYTGMAKRAFEITETVQYDLWKNVLARAEFRWDHAISGAGAVDDPYANGVDNVFLVAANLVYKF